MPRIEILFDKESKQKPTQAVMDALRTEIEEKIGAEFSNLHVRVVLSSSQSMAVTGTKTDDEKTRINEMLQAVWEDDSWLPE